VGAGFEGGVGVVGGAAARRAAERGIWAVSGSSKAERRKAHAVEE
jgi:predicted dinucleotide-binding enzyme